MAFCNIESNVQCVFNSISRFNGNYNSDGKIIKGDPLTLFSKMGQEFQKHDIQAVWCGYSSLNHTSTILLCTMCCFWHLLPKAFESGWYASRALIRSLKVLLLRSSFCQIDKTLPTGMNTFDALV